MRFVLQQQYYNTKIMQSIFVYFFPLTAHNTNTFHLVSLTLGTICPPVIETIEGAAGWAGAFATWKPRKVYVCRGVCSVVSADDLLASRTN